MQVVRGRKGHPLDVFSLVKGLFQATHVLVEMALQVLVRVINAQLLERVLVENFKPENVQNVDFL